jgi:hypothetical protein
MCKHLNLKLAGMDISTFTTTTTNTGVANDGFDVFLYQIIRLLSPILFIAMVLVILLLIILNLNLRSMT